MTPAESGDAALLLAAIHPPDVIVSDVLMPRMDGFSLCREVRRDRHLSRVPIVLMSAHYVETEDRDLAAGFGATRYVSRTGGFDVVVGAVVDAMELPVSDGEGSRGTRRSSALNRGAAANLK